MIDPVIVEWTGATARRLQEALRMTNQEFAEHLGVATRTVAGWRANPGIVPTREVQRALDTAYRQEDPDTRARFGALLAPAMLGASPVVEAEQALLQARLDALESKLSELGISW